jgi:exosortase/archaeosortase family protein
MNIAAVDWGRSPGRTWWRPREHALGVRVLLVVASVAVAYHYSLETLLRDVSLDTPLAYLGLVPFIAFGLVVARARPAPHEPAIHDRELDYIVGVPLVAIALVMLWVLPARMSTLFWSWRIDLLSLPLFVSGCIIVVFGLRAAWRMRVGIAYLLLAWPVPYVLMVDRWLSWVTTATLAAVHAFVHLVPIATVVSGGDGSVFTIPHAGHPFSVSVASVCAGVNGTVGFALVGTAFAVLVDGPRLRKTAWLAGGIALLWLGNVARVLVIFTAGRWWGQHVAIDALHPYLGLVTFALGVGVMVVTMPLFGLGFRSRPPVLSPAEGDDSPWRRLNGAVPHARLAMCSVLVAAMMVGVANRSLAQYQLVAGSLGEPRVTAFGNDPPAPPGWHAALASTFPWSSRFFGAQSTWQRYTYVSLGGKGALRAGVPVVADAVLTSDLHRFDVYGLEACYRFHGFRLRDVRSVDLGGGVTGTAVSYVQSHTNADWTAVYWHWPVLNGSRHRYERVVLMMADTGSAQSLSPASSPPISRRLGIAIDNATRGRPHAALDTRLTHTRTFLVDFARNVIAARGATS